MTKVSIALARLCALSVTWLAASCTSSLSLENRSCPCATGWVCCSDGLCAKDQSSCPGAGTGGNGSMGGDPGPITDAGPGTDAGAAMDVVPREDPRLPTYPPDPPVIIPEGLVGSWSGYFENFKFPSGSDTVTMTLAQGTLTLTLGAGPVPPPTDPTVAWPPMSESRSKALVLERSIEGVPYTAHEVHWTGQRLTFKVAPDEALQSWCALQTPHFVNDVQAYQCLPGVGLGLDGDKCYVMDNHGATSTLVSCNQYWECFRCVCTATGCRAGTARDVSFDITFDGSSASGSALLPEGKPTLRLTAMH